MPRARRKIGAASPSLFGRFRRSKIAKTLVSRQKSHHFWCESHQNAPLVLFLQLR
ncbi:MAG: hypothetical protein IJ387_05715 [Thermoguttaceae bacterium]|nr:hypothetical protein [Thermoguttaceae bacterium]